MDKLFNPLLFIHILTGGLSLVCGTVVLLSKKGNGLHRCLGKVYFYSLFVSCLVALPMCYLHPNLFLATISIISLYMLHSGMRYIQIKDVSDFNSTDRVVIGVMAVVSATFSVWGLLLLVQQNNFGLVLLILGLITLNFVRQDLLCLLGINKYSNFGLVRHLQRLCGSYISSLTAFVVVNNTFLPGVVAWLLPAAVIAPIIVWWSRRWGKN
jgi:uncharacterized membrane protein